MTSKGWISFFGLLLLGALRWVGDRLRSLLRSQSRLPFHLFLVSALLVKIEAGKVRLYRIFISWPKTQLEGPYHCCRRSILALLPMAVIGSRGSLLRYPPSKRQDT